MHGDRSRATETIYEVPDSLDVRAVRRTLAMTQVEFCATFGFKLGTLRNWEQGRATPQRQDRAFLSVIAKEPDAVKRALLAA